MNDTIQNTVAKIFAIEDTGSQIRLKDENKKSLGSFFKEKKAGGLTVAYQQFVDMGLKSGSVVSIGFKEVPYKDGTVKNIIGFRETSDVPAKTPQQAAQPKYEPMGETKPDWDEIAVGKVQSLFLQAFIQSGKTFSEAKLQVTQARQLAELVVYGQQKSGTDEPLPEPPPEETPNF